jgi:4-alpha-glucanotransferase
MQWIFDGQWKKLKNFANGNRICIVGDILIFVGFDSAGIWANRQIFKLRRDVSPKFVAGVPPDAFSETEQLWETPSMIDMFSKLKILYGGPIADEDTLNCTAEFD